MAICIVTKKGTFGVQLPCFVCAPALKRWGPLEGRGYVANLPTCGPPLTLSPAMKRWGDGPTRWHGPSSCGDGLPHFYVVARYRCACFKVADPPDAGISKEEDTAIPIRVARKFARRMPVDETKPLFMGDWLSNKDIIAWLNHKLYLNEIGEPCAWTTTVTYTVSRPNIMKKYEGSEGIKHTIVGLEAPAHT